MSQIVGKACGHCEQNITVIFQARACPQCQQPYHVECFDKAPGCKDCGPEPIAVPSALGPVEKAKSPEQTYLLGAAVLFVAMLGLFFLGKNIARQPVSIPNRPVAHIETTMGMIKLRLYVDKAPKTVANFVKLARSGFYNDIIVHRVIPGFMIQTGDPNGDGSGGPGYSFDDEIDRSLSHDRPGILSMANSGPGTNGSQFFITLGESKNLDGKHSIFGEVYEGLEICRKIGYLPRDGSTNKPHEPPKMLKVTIHEGR
jgi:cyclophilin family peptidyl-prolyl cis-trans isomerase